MGEFLRRVIGVTTGCLLVIVLAVSAAVAVAESGPGKEGTKTKTVEPKDDDPADGDDSDTEKRQLPKENSGDRGKSEDKRRDGTGSLPHPGKPKQGKTVNAKPGKGKGKDKIDIKLPGAANSVPLESNSSVPVGSVLDARHGEVTVTTVPRADGTRQSATFSGAVFKVLQHRTGAPTTEIRLRGGNFASCKRPLARRTLAGRLFSASTSASKKRKVRSLWGSGHGNFRTRGRGGAATVRGTIWLTEDRCDGTLVRVRRGVVKVRDFAKKKTVTVRRGHSYFARINRR
jgi:hypothetical protein